MTQQEIKVALVSPEDEGWKRHPVYPRTWIKPGGQLYLFPPGQREKLVLPIWPWPGER